MSEAANHFVLPGMVAFKKATYQTGLRFLVLAAFILMYILPRFLFKFEIRGKDRMQWDGRTLYLGRHRNGTVGTFGVQAQIRFPVLFKNPEFYPFNVSKKKHLWFLGPLAPYLRIFLLPSEKDYRGREKIFEKEVEVLRREKVDLTLFPTGTRDRVGQTRFSRYHSNKAMGKLLQETKPKVVFYYDDDSHVFTKMQKKFSQTLRSKNFWKLPWMIITYRRPTIFVTISKAIDTSKTNTKLGRMCNDPSVTAEEITQELWNLHALWALNIDPKATLPVDQKSAPLVSEDFDNLYGDEAF